MPNLSTSHLDSNPLTRFVHWAARTLDPAAALLILLTAVGAHIGRTSAVIYKGVLIYPTLYVIIVGSLSRLWEAYRPFGYLPGAPPMTKAGIANTQALVYHVRDPVNRPDKVYTEPRQDPEWRRTTVDFGACEKRLLIMQPLVPELTGKSAGARHLLDTFKAAYFDGELWVYSSYRDGGFHGTRGAHVALLMAETNAEKAAAILKEMPFLIAEGSALYPEDDVDVLDMVSDIPGLIQSAPQEVTVAPDCIPIIEMEKQSKRPYAVLTLLRLAHVLAVLAGSRVVTLELLNQAQSIVEASNRTGTEIQNKKRAAVVKEVLALFEVKNRTRPWREISKHLRRRYSKAELREALAHLEHHQLEYALVPTKGRPREEWRVREAT